MIGDIWTIMRKEFKEFLIMRGRRVGLTSIAVVVGMFGLFMPLQSGPGWFAQPLVLFYAYLPFVMAMGIVADAFAGERERRTLENLLASRLPDTAILFGKIAFIVSYSWGMSLVSMLTAVIALNLKYGHATIAKSSTMVIAGMHMSMLSVVVGVAFLGLILATLMTAIGILLSMKASSVKQVQQTMGFVMMGFFLVPTVGAALIPHTWMSKLFQSASAMGVKEFALLVAAVFVLLDVVLLALAIARFKRAKLIMD